MKNSEPILLLALGLLLSSCLKDKTSQHFPTLEPARDTEAIFVLNQGNYGANNASLDYYNYTQRQFTKHFFTKSNENLGEILGDAATDMLIYGSHLYISLYGSHCVLVLRTQDASYTARISIPSPRHLTAHEGKVYVTSYIGPDRSTNGTKGAVYPIDTVTQTVGQSCKVGYQPEGITAYNGLLYVCNSGRARPPEFDSTVSVLVTNPLRLLYHIPVGKNIQQIAADQYGNLWVNALSSQGGKSAQPSHLFCLSVGKFGQYVPTRRENIPCDAFTIHSNRMYLYSTRGSAGQPEGNSFRVMNLETPNLNDAPFIKDGTEKAIVVPNGITVHPSNGDVYICDAKDSKGHGELYCYTADGVLKWKGDAGMRPLSVRFAPPRANRAKIPNLSH